MPIFIIDTCADTIDGQKQYLASFFRDIFDLHGYCIVVGGTRHWKEINGKASLLSVVRQLKEYGRLKVIDSSAVDAKESEIRARALLKLGDIPPCCDDFHLLALSLLADCQNVISAEQRLRDCVDIIRPRIGHAFCPKIKLIRDEATYRALKGSGKL